MADRRGLVALLAKIIRENRQALSLSKLKAPNLKDQVFSDCATGLQTFIAELIAGLGSPNTCFFELICFPENFLGLKDGRLNLHPEDSAYLNDPNY